MKNIGHIIQEAMATLIPSAGQMKDILSALREELGIEGNDLPVWKKYLTFTEGGSNKYHYFAVFKNGSSFVAANAYGRIGYPASVNRIGDFSNLENAKKAAEDKVLVKMKKGYDVTSL